MESEGHELLSKIINEIKENCVSVVWNSGLDSVLFINRSVDGKKSLEDILMEHLYNDKN